MRAITFLILLLSPMLSHADWKKLSLVNGCHVFDHQGEQKKSFPGNFCQFFDDGSFISASPHGIRLIRPGSQIKWEIKESIHHQVNLSPDQKRVLALSSNFVQQGEKWLREDKFLVLSLEGKILQQQVASAFIGVLKKKLPYNERELTHFNSFYEIPPLSTARPLPEYLKAGNYIANSYKLGTFILSPDLKKVLHHFSLPQSENHQVHDVQVMENGNILLFNNVVAGSREDNAFSAVQEYDPVTKKLVLDITATPKQMFFSRHCGGVQRLDKDLILFSHMVNGTYLYSIKRKNIIANIFKTHVLHTRFYPAQQVKAMDLKRFLEHWK